MAEPDFIATYGSLDWTIEPLTPLAIEWSPSSGSPHDPAPQRHALGHGRPARGLVEKALLR